MTYCPTIGLEIHSELKTKSKMFCSSANNPEEKRPNVNVCPVCFGHPGTMPVINEEAVKYVIRVGLALNCSIAEHSKFDRKNYFYPDLPKGYQISQYDMPLCGKGFLEVNERKIKITRVHLEEDTGKLIHPDGADYSLVDFNRAGVPLMELVTEPDIASAQEAREFAQELQLILRYLNVSDADMEKGQMRVEANISLAVKGAKSLGTKVEIKNLNSFKAVEKAIDFEIKRQAVALEKGEKVIQETRGWDDVKGRTISQRKKEEAHDYRYFPEPDLPHLTFNKNDVEEIANGIPELPQARRKRLAKEYSLETKNAEFFVQNKDLGEFFEQVVSEFEPNLGEKELQFLITIAANYLITDLQGMLKANMVKEENLLITPENFAEFITMIDKGEISSKIAKVVLAEMFKAGADPSHIIEEKGLEQISDEDVISSTAGDVVAENPKAVEDFAQGKKEAIQFLIGKMMSKTRGRIAPDQAKEALKKHLSG